MEAEDGYVQYSANLGWHLVSLVFTISELYGSARAGNQREL